jgi:hypothetical protein
MMKKCGNYVLHYMMIFALSQSLLIINAFEKPIMFTADKHMIYKRLAELESQRDILKSLYEKALKRIHDEEKKDRLLQEYEQKDNILSQQIDEQRNLLITISQQEWWWQAAQFFGTVAMTGFLTYKFLTIPQLPVELPSKVEDTSQDVPTVLNTEQPEGTSKKENVLSENPIERPTQEEHDSNKTASTLSDSTSPIITTPQVQIPKEIKPDLQNSRIKLTPEEIALYKMRYKTYKMYATGTILSTVGSLLVFGPVALPIDLILFALSGAAAEQARYYKKKLYAAK